MPKQRSIKIETLSIEEKAFEMDEIRSEPITVAYECRTCIAEVDEKYYKRLYHLLSVVYALALQFNRSPEHWELFRADPFCEKLKQAKPHEDDELDRIIYWVCRFMFKAVRTDGRPYNRAFKYARALQRYARQDASWKEVPSKLMEDGGVEHAYELEAEEHRPQAANDNAQDSSSDSDGSTDQLETEGQEKPSEPRSSPKQTEEVDDVEVKKSQSSSGDPDSSILKGLDTKPQRPRFDPKRHLLIDAKPEQLEKVLGLLLFDAAEITVECRGFDCGWNQIVATKVKVTGS